MEQVSFGLIPGIGRDHLQLTQNDRAQHLHCSDNGERRRLGHAHKRDNATTIPRGKNARRLALQQTPPHPRRSH